MSKDKTKKSIYDPMIYRPADVAAILGVSPYVIRSMIAKGFLPKPGKIGQRFTFWPKKTIDDIVMGNVIPTEEIAVPV